MAIGRNSQLPFNCIVAEILFMVAFPRRDLDSPAYTGGCWIGLQDAFGTGYYNWRDPASMLDISFRDWRRGSDRSDRQNLDNPGDFIDNGDNCVLLVPWQEDPVIKEQGSFEEISCIEEERAFVCQMLVTPHRWSITATGRSVFNGGGIRGGFLNLFDSFEFREFFAENTAVISTKKSEKVSNIGTLILRDGSEFNINSNVMTTNETFIGEETLFGRQPVVRMMENTSLTCSTTCSDCESRGYSVVVNARVETANDVTIQVGHNVNLVLKQGGDIASAKIAVEEASTVLLDGYAMQLSTYDAFDLTLTHR